MERIIEREHAFQTSGGTAYRLAELINELMYTDDPEVVALFDDAVEEAREDFKQYVTLCIDNARELELTVDGIDAEIARLRLLKEQRTGRAERLRNTVKRYCELVGISELMTDLYTVRIKKNPPAVEIVDGMILSSEYMTEKVTMTPNKKLIAEHLKAGVVVDGARLIINTRIEIK